MKRAKDDNTIADIKDATAAYETGGVRTTGRVKKPKTVFDPSDNYVSRAQRTAAAATAAAAAASATVTSIISNNVEHELPSSVNIVAFTDAANADNTKGYDICCKCQKSEAKRGQGFKSKFLTCKTCSKKCHIRCVPVDFENLSSARKKFKCENCRTCCICVNYKGANNNILTKNKDFIMCCVCVDTFHVDCHFQNGSKSKILNERAIVCSKCVIPIAATTAVEVNATNQSAATVTTASPPLLVVAKSPTTQNKLVASPKSTKIVDERNAIQAASEPSTPEPTTTGGVLRHIDTNQVKDWTVQEVVKFFMKHYPNEANVFQEQDIDGASLLLLKRRDIIKRFNLKLGPSLRLYELVSTLQSKKDIVQNAWND